MAHYDYIILGAGAAGLMLASSMAMDPWFQSASILIVEKDPKDKNDRTWCFWETGPGPFDHLLHKRWEYIRFRSSRIDKNFQIAPYSYKMLRSADFYRDKLQIIDKAPNIDFLHDHVQEIWEDRESVHIRTARTSITGTYVFNSLFQYEKITGQRKYPVLQQHFVGWFIKTERAVFDPEVAVFMDFKIPQKGNTRFMYILPFSEHEALVEYTLFSEHPLEEKEYEEAIEAYLSKELGISEYSILEKEKGNIPMTCYNFEEANSDRLIHIGTAGGWAKPSTGFTFKNTARNTQKLIDHLKEGKAAQDFSVRNRFWFYDLLLLDILYKHNELGSEIFGSMFRNRSPQLILKFLDEESNLFQDLQVISGCPFVPFSKALIQRIF